MNTIDRRLFIRNSLALGAGAAATGGWPGLAHAHAPQGAGIPVLRENPIRLSFLDILICSGLDV